MLASICQIFDGLDNSDNTKIEVLAPELLPNEL